MVKSLMKNYTRMWVYIFIGILIISISVSYLTSKYVLPKVYESSSTLIIHGDTFEGDHRALRDARVYRAIATSSQTMMTIKERLDLPLGINELRDKIIVSYQEDAGLIYLTAEDEEPETAFLIVESLVDELQIRVGELFGGDYLKVIDSPYIPSGYSRPSITLNILIAAVFSVLLSALIIFCDVKRR